ncbi:hypothetical protein [Nocardia otitidiscaviarum]|uniref:hypothetical protein n=1 Tax=Nocardia otitidiscaviarum TaxID=1823 RepID=UPI001E341E58|nr:hypothetical protein [Nocardia otitidiscaviarum]
MTMSTPLSLQQPEPPTHRPSRRERRAAELEDRTRAVGAKLVGISARPAKQVLHDLDSVRAGLDHADADNLVLMGTSVTSGTGTGVVVATGSDTYFGSMADIMVGAHPETAFDTG